MDRWSATVAGVGCGVPVVALWWGVSFSNPPGTPPVYASYLAIAAAGLVSTLVLVGFAKAPFPNAVLGYVLPFAGAMLLFEWDRVKSVFEILPLAYPILIAGASATCGGLLALMGRRRQA